MIALNKIKRQLASVGAILFLLTPLTLSAETTYISHAVSDDSIVIDAALDDWSAVESLGYDSETLQDAGVKADFVEAWIAHDNNNLYVAYKNNGDIDRDKWWPWQVYFDADGSASTGYSIDDNIGAEYMLQGSGVYKYTGSGSNWKWQYIVNATNAVVGPIAELKIPRLALSFPDKLKVVFKARNVAFTESYAESGVDTYPKQQAPIPFHYGLLQGQSIIWGEPGGEMAMTLSEAATVGSTTLSTSETYSLFDNQLISYRSKNGEHYEYYVAQVETVDGNTINLSKALEAPIAQGQNLWNFYGDASHANLYGSQAVVDFAIRETGINNLNSGKHVLLGDSWFDNPNPGFKERLSARLSSATIVNKGVGGHTSADVLSRLDVDVASENPDFVWVLVGINDATSDVEVTDYLANMQAIIAKIKSLGAKPIIFDSQVAQLFSGSDTRTQLTHGYSQGLADADAAVFYELSEPVIPPEIDTISNPKTIVIDGKLTDWNELQAFGQDADDINENLAEADLLEAWMAHDDDAFYIAYKNDGNINTVTWWPWQVFLDTDNNQGTGYQIGNGVGANYLVQGRYLYSYNGTGYNWAWRFVEAADYQVDGDVAELKFSRSAINNPDSLSTVLKARNGIFTNNYSQSGVDSFPDLDQGHFNYTFGDQDPGCASSVDVIPDAVEDGFRADIRNRAEVELNVFGNDIGECLTITNLQQARSVGDGANTRLEDGKVFYTPPSVTASDTFTYTIQDSLGRTDTASITVGVRDSENPTQDPVVTDEYISASPGVPIIINLLANDTDPDGDTLILDQVTGGSQGTTVKFNDGSGRITYNPTSNASGTDTFYYGVTDGNGANDSGQVFITF